MYDLPPESEYDYCDEEHTGEVNASQSGGRALKRQRAKEAADRKQQRQDIKKKREKATAKLLEGTSTGEMSLLEEGLRLARSASMEGKLGSRCWRFPEMTAAVVLLDQLQQQKQQQEERQAKRAQLAALPLRCEPLGVDREHRRYWKFNSEFGKLFVEEFGTLDAAALPPPQPGIGQAVVSPLPSRSLTMTTRRPASGSSTAGARAGSRGKKNEANRAPKYPPRARPTVSRWRYYRSKYEVQQLIDALDERGMNEKSLKRALQSDWASLSQVE